MKFPLVSAGALVWLAAALLLTDAAAQAPAQTTGSTSPGESAAKDEPPPGGCMPIGVTASGEIVFPFLCKGFIEQHKAANEKPAATDDSRKPAAADAHPKTAEEKSADKKSAAKQPDDVTAKSAEPAPEAAPQGSSQTPAAAEEQRPNGDGKPESAEDKSSAAKSPEATASIARSGPEAPEPALPERGRRKPRESREGPPGCRHFRSYDASSGTYTDYSGRRRACRS
ncbi:MAG: BA14K family protein [Bradyrhizobium sp.]|nr:BA14K family protein [Bradyrhizobium sp.]